MTRYVDMVALNASDAEVDGSAVWLMGTYASGIKMTVPSGRIADSFELDDGRGMFVTASADGRRIAVSAESYPD